MRAYYFWDDENTYSLSPSMYYNLSGSGDGGYTYRDPDIETEPISSDPVNTYESSVGHSIITGYVTPQYGPWPCGGGGPTGDCHWFCTDEVTASSDTVVEIHTPGYNEYTLSTHLFMNCLIGTITGP